MDDLYRGIGGSYVLDPKSGERVPAAPADAPVGPVVKDTPAEPAAEPKTTSKE